MTSPRDLPDKEREAPAALGTRGLLAGAAAVLAVLAALTYVAGGVVLAARMKAQGLYWATVLSQMPRQVLQEIAFSEVVVPAGLFAVLGYLLPRAALPRNWWPRRALDKCFTRSPMRSFLVLAVVLVVPGVFYWIHNRLPQPQWWLLALVAVAVPAIAFGIGAAVRRLRRHQGNHPLAWVALMSSAMMLTAVPGAVIAAASLPLQSARVCGPGYERDGAFIGAGSDWVYLGETSFDINNKPLPPQLLLFPVSRVDAVGITAGIPDCQPATGKLGTTTPAPSPAASPPSPSTVSPTPTDSSTVTKPQAPTVAVPTRPGPPLPSGTN